MSVNTIRWVLHIPLSVCAALIFHRGIERKATAKLLRCEGTEVKGRYEVTIGGECEVKGHCEVA